MLEGWHLGNEKTLGRQQENKTLERQQEEKIPFAIWRALQENRGGGVGGSGVGGVDGWGHGANGDREMWQLSAAAIGLFSSYSRSLLRLY